MGQQLAALDASMHPAATQHAAHQQHVAACWLISGCCGLICRLADPPADRAFRRCMRLVLHSGAAVQQLLADAPTDLLTAQVVVQLWAVTAWAAIAVSLETDSGVHSVPPALLHVWLQQTVESLGVLATVLQKQGGQRWVAPRGAEDLPGISALCMLLAILFVLILHAHFIFGLDQPFAEGVAKLRSTLATLLGMLCTSPALAAHRQQLLNNEELCVQLFGVLQPAVPALAPSSGPAAATRAAPGWLQLAHRSSPGHFYCLDAGLATHHTAVAGPGCRWQPQQQAATGGGAAAAACTMDSWQR